MSNALGFALRGDDAFLKAIDEADPDTFGVTCAECGCFHIGKFSEMEPTEAHCPDCGSDRGSFESPALGGGKPSVRSAARSPSPAIRRTEAVMGEHFNRLTPGELERLAYLNEELHEVGQIIGKIIRHGYESRDPTKAVPVTDDNRGGTIGWRNISPTNRHLLESEVADVLRALRRMAEAHDIDLCRAQLLAAGDHSNKYMHHQDRPTPSPSGQEGGDV